MQPLVFVLKPKDPLPRGGPQARNLKRHLKSSLIGHSPLLAYISTGTFSFRRAIGGRCGRLFLVSARFACLMVSQSAAGDKLGQGREGRAVELVALDERGDGADGLVRLLRACAQAC